MRIVAGKLRHRQIEMTNLPTTRETQDKVRQAIFNMIGPYFDGGRALDLFAGSGALALEAYSRGVEEIFFNDVQPQAIAVCKKNCAILNVTNAHFYSLDYLTFLFQFKIQMDYIFLDPPYRMSSTLEMLQAVYSILTQNGIIIFEMDKNSEYPEEYRDLKIWKNKIYGIKRVVIYRR